MIGAITAGLYGTGVPPVTNSYESIATVTVGSGGTSTISFTGIPSTFKHLQLRAYGHTNRSTGGVIDGTRINFNSDSSAVYTGHSLEGNGSSASAFSEGTSQTRNVIYGLAGNNGAANTFGVFILDILDYQNTSKNKTIRALAGSDNNGSGSVYLSSGLWMSTAAITQIDLIPNVGTSFNQYTQMALYGIKG